LILSYLINRVQTMGHPYFAGTAEQVWAWYLSFTALAAGTI